MRGELFVRGYKGSVVFKNELILKRKFYEKRKKRGREGRFYYILFIKKFFKEDY